MAAKAKKKPVEEVPLTPTPEVRALCKGLVKQIDIVLNGVIVNGRVPSRERCLFDIKSSLQHIADGKKYFLEE